MLSAVRGKLRSVWAKRGSIEISTVLEFLAVVAAASAAIVAGCAARDAKSTAKTLQAIEEERHDDEQLEDLVAAQITRYFSSSCEERAQMLASTLDRFYDLPDDKETEGVSRAEVKSDCEDAKDDDKEFVLHEIEVIGTPESDHAYAFAKLGYYNAPTEHELVGTTSLEIVMKLEQGWEDDEEDPTFPITSMAETIVCEPPPDNVSAGDWPCPS